MKKFLQMIVLSVLVAVPWAADAQFCTPSPSTKDGSGITNVTFGTGTEVLNSTVTWGSSPYYNDYRSQVGAVQAGTEAELSITFATGYTYGYIIWVDWNGDSTFSGTEVVAVGSSPSTNPVTVTATFDIASSQDTGSYMMRICAADMYFDSYTGSIAAAASVDPCDSYSWGVALDYTLHVLSAPTCIRPESLTATDVTSDGLTLSWVDAMNSGATYSIDYWKLGGDTNTVTSTTTSYTFTGLDANSLYYFAVKAVCSVSDESISLVGSFATACAGSTCDLTLELGSTSSYSNPFLYYGASVELFQNGVSLGAYSSNTSVEVCGTAPVVVVYHGASYYYYDNYASITVRDGGGVAVYTGGAGDTLCTIATPCPTCIPPTALAVMPDSNQIDFSWTPRSGASQFIVYLNDSVVSDNVTDTFYTFTGLPANTAFTVRVQSVCSADDSSSIASLGTRTACGEITLPYSVDFEDIEYNGAWYPCWDSVIHAGTDPSVNTTGAHAGTYGMYLQATSSEPYNLVVSPRIPTAGNNIYVRFWGYNTNTTWYRAGVMSNPRDTSTFIPLVDVVGSSWNEYEFRTDTVTGIDANTNYYVAWMAYKPGVSYNTQMGRFDDVYISEVPSCVRVSAIGVDTITDESITLTWVDGGNNGASYTVSYWSATSDTTTVTTSDTSYMFDNLSANTSYTFSVQVNCSGEVAETVTATFRTACGLTAIPYFEGFEDAGALSCWQMVSCAGNTGRITSDAHSGNACFRFSYNTNPPQYLISPELTGTDAGVEVEFWYKQGTSYTETFQVGYSTTGDSAEAFVWGEVITATSSYQVFDAIYPVGTKYVAVKLLSYDQLYLYIDDINFMLPPNCMPVSLLTVDTATDASATIHWTAPENQNSFIVRLNDSVYFNTADTFYTFSGLSQRTQYSVAVASDCSGDTSVWASISFITGCNNGECEITLVSTNDYASSGSYYASYSPQLRVLQNGVELASVQNTSEVVSVCTGMPVAVVYGGGSAYSYVNPNATIINGGDEEVFNGTTVSYTVGDTVVYMANACPSCLKPTVQIASVDSTELSFTWTVEGGTTYLVSFDNGAYTVNTTGMYTAYGLNPNTLHTFAVKAVCSVGDTSNPRTLTVKTSCGEMAIPYTESFEGDVIDDEPSCWTVVSAGVDGYPAVSDDGHTGNQNLALVSNGSNTAMIASNRIPLPGDSIKVSFWAYKTYGYGTFEAGMMTNPYVDSTFISMVTINASEYTLYEFNTNTLSHDSTYYLAFRYAYNSNYYQGNVDDINISLDEGCMTPTDVTATSDNVNPSVTVAWNCAGSLNDFVVEYRVDGTATWSTPQNTTTTSKLISGLAYSTAYEFRVGQVCGNDTLWSSTVIATTVCGMATLPYVENFVSGNGTLPPCWNYTNPTYFHWNRWTTHAETSGDGEMMVGGGSAGEAAILPAFTAPIIKLQISFDAKLGNISEGDAIMMGAYDESTGTVDWVDTLTVAGQSRESFVRFTYNYLDYSGTGTRIAIGHSHNNPSDWGMALDSIVVIELATCNPPQNIEAHNTMYPNTADDVYFTWTVSSTGTGVPSEWQLYFDTITSTDIIDSIPVSQLITVDTTYYMPPINTLAEGAHYRLFVRSVCDGFHYSDWVELQNGFSTDEHWMNNTGVADTIIGCDFIIYDNGGPVAGYLHNSNSALVIQAGEAGRELQLQGGFFSHGADANTFTVYDGIGTTGTVLYTRTNTNMTETIDSVLATTTTGAMTITFTSGYYAALGYELYIHCVGSASCTRPTNLQVQMVDSTTAYATWDSTGASFYRVYHHVNGDSVWNMNPSYTNSITLTGLPSDVMYDFYVVAYCSATDTSAPSIIRHFSTHWEAPCEAVTGLQVSDLTTNSATISWTSTGSQWEVNLVGNGTPVATTSNPYTFTGLTANTEYKVLVRNVCDAANNRYSEWSDTLTFTTAEEMYTITVTSNNESWGTVTGGGTFANGATTVIKATANSGYRFVSWQDGDTNAERTIVVTGDATYTATFASVNSIDDVMSSEVTLYPNPASTAVTIRGLEGECVVSVVDLNGREVYRTNASSSLTIDLTGYAKGAYFVRITGEHTAAIRKLIVK